MNHSPRRISIACTYCRYRKRKCDGQTPQCRTCRAKGLQCKYSDPETERGDEGPPHQTQAQRLDSIEALLHQQTKSLEALQRQIPQRGSPEASSRETLKAEASRNGVSGLSNGSSSSSTYRSAYDSPLSSVGTEGRSSSMQSGADRPSPPAGHINTHPTCLSDLLKLPQVCRLIGSYAEDFFLRVENQRERLPMVSAIMDVGDLEVDQATADYCFINFSKLAHPFYPFLECKESKARYDQTLARGLGSDPDSAFALAILAIGATSADPIAHSHNGKTSYSGDTFLQRCLKIILPLWSVEFWPDIVICETLVLCSIYFSFTVDPMMTWRFANMASTSIKQAMSRYPDKSYESLNTYILLRLSWVSSIIERDTHRGFSLPKSSIDHLTNEIPLPGYRGPDCSRSFFSLADITAMNILERLFETLDSIEQQRAGMASPAAFRCADPSGRLVGELNHQLEEWYTALPDCIKPDLTGKEKGTKQMCQLRLRYWNIKQSIYRPLVIFWTSADYGPCPPGTLEPCLVCLQACRAFISNAHHILSERTPYTYSVIQSCFSGVITLAVAAQDPQLKPHVGDIQADIKQALGVVEPWAQDNSSAKAMYDIMSLLAMKVQFGH